MRKNKEMIIYTAVILAIIILLAVGTYLMVGKAGITRMKKNFESRMNDGIEREILIINGNGDIIFELQGQFDFKYDSSCIEYVDTKTGKKYNIFTSLNSTVLINEL